MPAELRCPLGRAASLCACLWSHRVSLCEGCPLLAPLSPAPPCAPPQASLDKYMASDLFKQQGDPPHIKALSYTVYDVLPGTEKSIDLGAWGS